jgi:hypothetical protein
MRARYPQSIQKNHFALIQSELHPLARLERKPPNLSQYDVALRDVSAFDRSNLSENERFDQPESTLELSTGETRIIEIA